MFSLCKNTIILYCLAVVFWSVVNTQTEVKWGWENILQWAFKRCWTHPLQGLSWVWGMLEFLCAKTVEWLLQSLHHGHILSNPAIAHSMIKGCAGSCFLIFYSPPPPPGRILVHGFPFTIVSLTKAASQLVLMALECREVHSFHTQELQTAEQKGRQKHTFTVQETTAGCGN